MYKIYTIHVGKSARATAVGQPRMHLDNKQDVAVAGAVLDIINTMTSLARQHGKALCAFGVQALMLLLLLLLSCGVVLVLNAAAASSSL